jgi:hypothetical protein
MSVETHHKYPQTRTYHFLDGTQRRFGHVQNVIMGAWEHIWLPGDIVAIINPANVKYTICQPEGDCND